MTYEYGGEVDEDDNDLADRGRRLIAFYRACLATEHRRPGEDVIHLRSGDNPIAAKRLLTGREADWATRVMGKASEDALAVGWPMVGKADESTALFTLEISSDPRRCELDRRGDRRATRP